MSLLLRIPLATLFVTISIMIYTSPLRCRSYVNERYGEIMVYLHSYSNYLSPPKNLITNAPILIFQLISLFLIIGAILILLNIRKGIIFYAYVVTVIGVILNVPYTKKEVFKQSKRLLLVFLIFFNMIILTTLRKRSNNQEAIKAKPN